MADECNNQTPYRGVTIGGEAPPLSADGFQEILCPDEPGVPAPEPPFEESCDCQRAAKRLGPLCDENGDPLPEPWYTLKSVTVGDKERCQFVPDIGALIGNATPTQAARICRWLVDNCLAAIAAALLALPSFITGILNALFPAICARIVSVHDFDGDTGPPDCSLGGNACLKLYRDTALIDDDCPGGRVTHACVNGVLICFGGTGTGGSGPPTYQQVTVNGAAECPVMFPRTYGGTTVNNIAELEAALSAAAGGAVTVLPSSDPANPCHACFPDGVTPVPTDLGVPGTPCAVSMLSPTFAVNIGSSPINQDHSDVRGIGAFGSSICGPGTTDPTGEPWTDIYLNVEVTGDCSAGATLCIQAEITSGGGTTMSGNPANERVWLSVPSGSAASPPGGPLTLTSGTGTALGSALGGQGYEIDSNGTVELCATVTAPGVYRLVYSFEAATMACIDFVGATIT